MKWPNFAVGVLVIASGIYAMSLKDTKTGAALIGVGALLIDPSDVIAAVKAWKGGSA